MITEPKFTISHLYFHYVLEENAEGRAKKKSLDLLMTILYYVYSLEGP